MKLLKKLMRYFFYRFKLYKVLHFIKIKLDNSRFFLFFLEKYSYIGFDIDFKPKKISSNSLKSSVCIRGNDNPIIFINSIMHRSGSGYISHLVRLHPDIYIHPNDLWEVPILKTIVSETKKMHKLFLYNYSHNKGKIGELDFFPLFGSAFINYIKSFVPNRRKRIVLVNTSVDYLNYFYSVFPYEKLIILIRDGRDIVYSSLKTFEGTIFIQKCYDWKRSAELTYNFINYFKKAGKEFHVFKYEDIWENPYNFIKLFCKVNKLDLNKYPFEEMNRIGIIGSSQIKLNGKVFWDKHPNRPQDFNPVGRWRSWSIRRKRIFNNIGGEMLIKFGYEKDLNW